MCLLGQGWALHLQRGVHKGRKWKHFKTNELGTSLVAQWLRICLPMQGTRVRSLVWEDPTCLGAAKPVHHNYWACALEPVSHNYWARMPQLLKPAHPRAHAPQREATAMRSPRTATHTSPHSPQLEKARMRQQRPNAAKKKKEKKTNESWEGSRNWNAVAGLGCKTLKSGEIKIAAC